jgi:hypothetical protein
MADISTHRKNVEGQVAHDSAAAGNPILIAGRGNANEPAVVSTDGDSVYLWSDLFGRMVFIDGHSSPEAPINLNATASGDTTVIAAPGASVSLHICKGLINNTDSQPIIVALRDGTAGTIRWRMEVAANGGGARFDFGMRGWKLTANTLLAVNLASASNVQVNVEQYYIAP